MGIRLTGISTPVGGLSWEYTKAEEKFAPLMIPSGQKIKVFISSICGIKKYDKVRTELKNAIEDTQLAEVYTFENKGASTLSAGNRHAWALVDSDICIFLIDNADGITPEMQVEIDTVKKHGIKALYYFCDENQKGKTALEQSLIDAHLAKSKTVHSFSELYNGPRNPDHGWKKDREHGRISESTERGNEPWHEQRTARSTKQNWSWRY